MQSEAGCCCHWERPSIYRPVSLSLHHTRVIDLGMPGQNKCLGHSVKSGRVRLKGTERLKVIFMEGSERKLQYL